jgi:hypothetical protein
MGKLADRMLQDLDEIKKKLDSHTIELTQYNLLLKEHMARTEHLESRVMPIEDHVKFLRRLGRLATSVLAAASTIAGIIALFMRH